MATATVAPAAASNKPATKSGRRCPIAERNTDRLYAVVEALLQTIDGAVSTDLAGRRVELERISPETHRCLATEAARAYHAFPRAVPQLVAGQLNR
jgi:hypothetical protein